MKKEILSQTAKIITLSLLLCLSARSHAIEGEGTAAAAPQAQPPGSARLQSNSSGRAETTVRACNILTVTHTFQGTAAAITQGLDTSGDVQLNRNNDGTFNFSGRASVGNGSQYMLPAGQSHSASSGPSVEQVTVLFERMASILQQTNGLEADGGERAPGQPVSAADAISLLQAAQRNPSSDASKHVFDAYLAALREQRSASVGTSAPITSSTITENCRVNTSTSTATNEITVSGSEENGYQVASLVGASNSTRRLACGNMAGLFTATRSRTRCR